MVQINLQPREAKIIIIFIPNFLTYLTLFLSYYNDKKYNLYYLHSVFFVMNCSEHHQKVASPKLKLCDIKNLYNIF